MSFKVTESSRRTIWRKSVREKENKRERARGDTGGDWRGE
jgi:hypothetical protein